MSQAQRIAAPSSNKQRLDRAGVKRLFVEHAEALGASSIRRAADAPYTFHLSIMDQDRGLMWAQTALVLVRSSDYWQQRIHLLDHDLTLLIVWKHDSIVPLPVLALDSGHWHSARTHTRQRTTRNRYTAWQLLGELLCGMQSAYDELDHISYQAKHRYLKRVHELMHRAKGRPVAV
jgi:hypothetical protein